MTAPAAIIPPPPPLGGALHPPPADPGAPPPRRPERHNWRERLPVIVAWAGSALVIMAVAGFASSTWDALNAYGQSLALVAAATALSVGSLWTGRQDRAGLVHLGTALWVSATACVVGAVWLSGSEALPTASRIVILLAGLAGVAHAGAQWFRRSESIVLQLATLASAVYGAGPIGVAVSDRYGAIEGVEWFTPLAGLFDPTVGSDAFLLMAIGHLVAGVVWLMLSMLLPPKADTVARVAGSILVAYAALALNVLTHPIGAALALLIVVGYLVAGLALDDGLLTVIGSVGALISGVRVIWSLFTGEVAVTITVFTAGVLMLGWSYQAMRQRKAA